MIANPNNNIEYLGEIIDTTKKDKIYTLACRKTVSTNDEQITYLIDEDKKIKMTFYTDGYNGISADYLKGILNFLGIKYFECVYTKLPEKYYYEYKEYDWRCGNEIL